MAYKTSSTKWKETELDQKIQLQQLEIEKQRIISRRFYIAIWLMIVFLLMGCAIYGLATENLGLGVPCLVFGFAIGLGGVEFLVIKSVVKNIRENRRKTNK